MAEPKNTTRLERSYDEACEQQASKEEPDEAVREYTRDELTLFEQIVDSPTAALASFNSIKQQRKGKVIWVDCTSLQNLLNIEETLKLLPQDHDIFLFLALPPNYFRWDLIEQAIPPALDNTLFRLCPEDLRLYLVRMGTTRDYELPENSRTWPPDPAND